MAQYNFKNPAVKRLMKEAQELREPTDQYYAHPLDDNLFEWHFTVRGPEETDFEGGLYHGRIILPPEYPMKPPSIILLTPNGRFELHKKICLSISGYHPESWQPSWSIRTAVLAIIGFMPTKGEGAIGALDYTPTERKSLAKKSQSWSCKSCGPIKQILKEPGHVTAAKSQSQLRDEELAKQISFSNPKPQKSETSTSEEASSPTPSDSSPGTEEGLRQRHVTSAAPEATDSTNAPPVAQPTPNISTERVRSSNPQRVRQQDDTTPLMLIIVLSVVLAVLILRRLDRAYDLRANLADMF